MRLINNVNTTETAPIEKQRALKQRLKEMLKRNHNRLHRYFIYLTVGLAVFLGSLANPKSSLGVGKTRQHSSIQNWDCVQGGDYLRDRRRTPFWLSSKALTKLIVERKPINVSPLLGRHRVRGQVTIEVFIDQNGKVVCARGVKGHPLLINGAINSIENWVFKPYRVNGINKSILGRLVIFVKSSKG